MARPLADFNTKLQESAPGTIGGGAQDVWLVSIKNQDANPHTVRVFAICVTRPAGYEIVTNDATLAAAGGFNRQSVVCPTGKSVLGGGAAVIGENSADFNTKLQESAPATVNGGAQDVWGVAIRNEDGSPHTVRVSAICVPRPFGYEKIAEELLASPSFATAESLAFNLANYLCRPYTDALGRFSCESGRRLTQLRERLKSHYQPMDPNLGHSDFFLDKIADGDPPIERAVVP